MTTRSSRANRRIWGNQDRVAPLPPPFTHQAGRGTHAVNLQTMKQLAWISYWNYGDTCPISHHLCSYPADDEKDPLNGFEFINSSQGAENVLMYGIPTRIKEMGLLDPIHGQGNQLYRVRYDGKSGQMELMENVAETTGIGLGVHTTVYPDASGFSVRTGRRTWPRSSVGPKASREKTKVLAAFKADWIPSSPYLGNPGSKGDDPPAAPDPFRGRRGRSPLRRRLFRLSRDQGEQDQLRDGPDG